MFPGFYCKHSACVPVCAFVSVTPKRCVAARLGYTVDNKFEIRKDLHKTVGPSEKVCRKPDVRATASRANGGRLYLCRRVDKLHPRFGT